MKTILLTLIAAASITCAYFIEGIHRKVTEKEHTPVLVESMEEINPDGKPPYIYRIVYTNGKTKIQHSSTKLK